MCLEEWIKFQQSRDKKIFQTLLGRGTAFVKAKNDKRLNLSRRYIIIINIHVPENRA